MSGLRERAWRFVNPEFDDKEQSAGLRVSNRGGIDMVEGGAAVRQSILMLLATRPGERVMRPHYGCHLHRLVFSPNDGTTAGLAIHYVRQAIERWEPRIDVIHLDATRSEDEGAPGLLEIFLEYRVRATQQTDRLAYAFDLTGERT
jgi:phage baseplate assembly protein W